MCAKMRVDLRPLGFVVLTAFALFVMAACDRKPEAKLTSRVVVLGEADTDAAPDTVEVLISVVTQNRRALEAQQQNARKTEAVIAAVKQASGGGEPQISTSSYSLLPEYTYTSRMPSIIGYEARNSVLVRMTKLDNVGAVIDAATDAGANSIQRVNFTLKEVNPARDRTLAEATKRAYSKAEAIAQALGGRVTRIVEQQEAGAGSDRYMQDDVEKRRETSANLTGNMNAAMSQPTTPVAAGTLNVRSQVRLIVEIEK